MIVRAGEMEMRAGPWGGQHVLVDLGEVLQANFSILMSDGEATMRGVKLKTVPYQRKYGLPFELCMQCITEASLHREYRF